MYQDAGIMVYLGGTLFEAFLVRGQFDDYRRLLHQLGLDTLEVSDGSIDLNHDIKCELIRELTKEFRTLSEVGSKEAGIIIHPNRWKTMMRAELDAGSWKVIAEARESGNVGIYRPNGSAHVSLINQILEVIPKDRILWEAPLKPQQVWFINELGANVNLGNIAPNEVIPLETLRLGVRGDTFFNYLPSRIDVNRIITETNIKSKMKEVTVSELNSMLKKGETFQLIDVREPWEAEICSIGAESIPLGEVMNRVDEIKKDIPVVVHCRSGARSANIINVLEMQLGFTNLHNLKGGILAWANEIDESLEQY